MKKVIFLARVFLSIAILITITEDVGTTIEKEKIEIEFEEEIQNQKKITQYFVEAILPVQMKQKGLEFTVNRIKEDMRRMPWLDDTMLNDVKGCNNLYLVAVEFKENKFKYLFCMEDSFVNLISAFKQRDNVWFKIENEKD